MGALADAQVYLNARGYAGSGDWLDQSGNGHDAQLGSTSGADTNDPLFLAKRADARKYAYFPGSAGNYASAADQADFDITGDIDLRWHGALDDYTTANQGLVIRESAFNTLSWRLIVTADLVRVYVSEDGTASVIATSSETLSVSDGEAIGLRVTIDVSEDEATFYTSSDNGATWDQLGTVQSLSASIASIFTGSAPIEIGSRRLGTGWFAAGRHDWAEVYDGIGGTRVCRFDANLATEPYASFAGPEGNTWTINRSSSGRKTAIVDRDMFLLGTDDYFEIADHADLDIAAGVSLTLACLIRSHEYDADQVVVGKKDATGSGAGYGIITTTTGAGKIAARVSDGTDAATVEADATDGADHVVVLRLDRSVDELELFLDGVSQGTADASAVGDLSNALPLRIGATGNATPASFFDGLTGRASLWRRALSDDEIAGLEAEFEGGTVAPRLSLGIGIGL